MRDDLQRLDVGRSLDDAFAEADAEGEVLQIDGRGHHDGVCRAVIDERDRHLFGHLALGQHVAG